MNEEAPLGFVRSERWTVKDLHHRTVAKTVARGNADPFRTVIIGTLSAKNHGDGMILNVVTAKDGKEFSWPVTQVQIDSMRTRDDDSFEIPTI